MPMKTITVPIAKGRTNLCALVESVQGGDQVILTSHGQPKAVITAFRERGTRWRVAKPDDPKRYGNLQSPVMDEWQ